jgi:hypothetical protein
MNQKTNPQNAQQESFENRLMDVCWGIPDPEDVECPVLKEAAEMMKEYSENNPEMTPDGYSWYSGETAIPRRK